MDRGMYEEAILSFDKIIEIESENPNALLGLARSYQGLNYQTDAEKAYSMVLELDQSNASAWIDLAELYISQGKLSEARELLQAATKAITDPEVTELYDQTAVDEPVFSHASGSYDDYFVLTIENLRPDQAVYYTTDGSQPDTMSNRYEDGIVISNPQTQIRAFAINAFGYQSNVSASEFEITVPAVRIEPEWEDQELYQALCAALHVDEGELYNYHLAQLRRLYIIGYNQNSQSTISAQFYSNRVEVDNGTYHTPYGNVRSLNLLSYCKYLESLNISFQSGIDLDGIRGLSELTDLSLLHTEIHDISVLSSLTSLERLSLGWNEIEDISPIGALTKLQSLGLWDNNITDISALSNLKELYYLDVSNNAIVDISVVKNMPYLTELWIYNNRISDLDPVLGLTQLDVLMLRDNPIGDYEVLQSQAYRYKRIDTIG